MLSDLLFSSLRGLLRADCWVLPFLLARGAGVDVYDAVSGGSTLVRPLAPSLREGPPAQPISSSTAGFLSAAVPAAYILRWGGSSF